MAGLVPAIHALLAAFEDVDARDKRGHDGIYCFSSLPDLIRQSMRHLSMDHRVKPGGDERGSRSPAAILRRAHALLRQPRDELVNAHRFDRVFGGRLSDAIQNVGSMVLRIWVINQRTIVASMRGSPILIVSNPTCELPRKNCFI
jgi:hypothetical protein